MSGIAGIILAGGLSRRMGGGDKCLLPLGGRTLLSHVIHRLSPQVSALAINVNGDLSRFEGFGLPTVRDSVEGYAGPLAGILAGMEWGREQKDVDAIVTVASDTPFLPRNLVSRLAAASRGRGDGIVVAASGGRRHPVIALWPLSLAEALAEFLERRKSRSVAAFAAEHFVVENDFPSVETGGGTADPFFNINAPADLARAEAILSQPGFQDSF